jgi:hypothetical protein
MKNRRSTNDLLFHFENLVDERNVNYSKNKLGYEWLKVTLLSTSFFKKFPPGIYNGSKNTRLFTHGLQEGKY